jgi:hypothetical protein
MVYYTLAAVVSSTLYFVVFIPSNVGIRKAQRRIHADARRVGRKSLSGFPPLALSYPGFFRTWNLSRHTRVSNRGPSAEIFTP